MKRQIESSYSGYEGSKTLSCFPKFQIVTPQLALHSNPLFSAFSRQRLRKLSSNDNSKVKILYKQHVINHQQEIQTNKKPQICSTKSINSFNLLEGVLRGKKSQIKKIKLKEFYISEKDENLESITYERPQKQAEYSKMTQKRTQTLNQFSPKNSQSVHNNLQFFNRKKNLPFKLRAKSYGSFTKTTKNGIHNSMGQQKSLRIESLNKMNLRQEQKSLTIQANQIDSQRICRRILRSQKLNNVQRVQQQCGMVLQDVSQKLNKICQDEMMENEKIGLSQKTKNKRRIRKNHSQMRIQNNFQINPWNNVNKYQDKQNDIFFCY